jgi:predicted O-methyltransferase YrrM
MIEIQNLINLCLNGSGDSDQHLVVLFSLVLNSKAKKILELGVRNGTTTRALVAAASLLDSEVDSVDIQPANFLINFDKWKFYKSDALQFLKNNNKKYDFIFIDDWHGEDHVCKELELLEPYFDVTTIIVMHDLMHSFSHPYYNNKTYPAGNEFEGRGPYGGLLKFLSRTENKYEYVSLPVNHGLTILRRSE